MIKGTLRVGHTQEVIMIDTKGQGKVVKEWDSLERMFRENKVGIGD
jgi:hypothetical protein